MDRDCWIDVRPEGRLCDVAPTILQLFGMPQPPEMEGLSLISGFG
jgi:2,3-bisphosphoglycerate-independent phosphoglycerate mutase